MLCFAGYQPVSRIGEVVMNAFGKFTQTFKSKHDVESTLHDTH